MTINKEKKECLIINIALSADARVKAKEHGKVEKYQGLKMEIANMRNMKRDTVSPVVVGTLGAVSTDLEKWIGKIGIEVRLEHLKKTALLGTARILRMVLMQ